MLLRVTGLFYFAEKQPSTHAGRSALQVLILPGNPGSAGYYEAYIAALHAALQGQADIHAVSHLGHASSKKAQQHRGKVLSLVESQDSCTVKLLSCERDHWSAFIKYCNGWTGF